MWLPYARASALAFTSNTYSSTRTSGLPAQYYPAQVPQQADKLIALAMHFAVQDNGAPATKDPDTVRLVSIVENTQISQVCGVAQLTNQIPGNVSFNIRNAASGSASKFFNDPPTIVVLDYFWLETGYFPNQYGVQWPQNVERLFRDFRETLRHVILPIDRMSGDMKKMFEITDVSWTAGEGRDKLYYHLLDGDVSVKTHPLVAATLWKDEVLTSQDAARTHYFQAYQYLAHDYPFLLISRDEPTVAIAHLQGLCTPPAPEKNAEEITSKISLRVGTCTNVLARHHERRELPGVKRTSDTSGAGEGSSVGSRKAQRLTPIPLPNPPSPTEPEKTPARLHANIIIGDVATIPFSLSDASSDSARSNIATAYVEFVKRVIGAGNGSVEAHTELKTSQDTRFRQQYIVGVLMRVVPQTSWDLALRELQGIRGAAVYKGKYANKELGGADVVGWSGGVAYYSLS